MKVYDGCLACQYELEQIGPLHGPWAGARPAADRWRMPAREWAGDGPVRFNGKGIN